MTLRGRGSCKQISPAVIGGKSRSEAGQIQLLFSLVKSLRACNCSSRIALYPTAMASRRLALNLNQALRSRAALKAISPRRRGFATPIYQGINTESTTLANGLTVRTPLTINSILSLNECIDSNRALAMGADLDCWCLDRRWFKGRDRQDQWHGSLPGASGIQGIKLCSKNKTKYID